MAEALICSQCLWTLTARYSNLSDWCLSPCKDKRCCTAATLLWAAAEMEELQPSAEASTVGNEGDRQEVRKGKKGKKKGRAAAVIEGESTCSTSSRATFLMDPSKGRYTWQCTDWTARTHLAVAGGLLATEARTWCSHPKLSPFDLHASTLVTDIQSVIAVIITPSLIQ